jgi:hypothetical protein
VLDKKSQKNKKDEIKNKKKNKIGYLKWGDPKLDLIFFLTRLRALIGIIPHRNTNIDLVAYFARRKKMSENFSPPLLRGTLPPWKLCHWRE